MLPVAAVVAGVAAQDLFLGLGRAPFFRVGPRKDSAGVQVYSFNYVYAAVVFDKAGRIVDIEVDELEAWFKKYLSDVNGRVLNPATTNEKDKAKVDPLTAEEKAMLVDVRSGATMSLNDSHGSFVALIRDAWNKRKPFAGK